MAKELPYFKFYVSEWNDGDITLEDFKTQGVFINICSYYWSNNCDVSVKKLQKRFKNSSKQIKNLVDCGVIKIKNENILICFLDKQLSERNKLSATNSENARKRWSENDANASQSQSEIDAIKKRREERIIREDKNIRLENFKEKVHTHFEFDVKMRNAFIEYWTQINEGGKKFHFEKQKTFDIKKRLATWKRIDYEKNRSNNSASKGTEVPTGKLNTKWDD